MRQARIVNLVLLLAFSLLAFGQTKPGNDLKRIVDQAFPSDVARPAKAPGLQQNNYSCYSVFEGTTATPSLIAAAYSNETYGQLSMLQVTDGAATPIATIDDHQFSLDGGDCTLKIVNLAGDSGQPSLLERTIYVSFEGADWFFIFDGSKLRDIGALNQEFGSRQPPYTDMHQTQIVDVDHRGAMQILALNGDQDKFPQEDGIMATGTATLYAFDGAHYGPERTFQYFKNFNDQRGKPYTWNENIQLRNPAAAYTLSVVNGTRRGDDRASAARVVLNGRVILSPNDLNQNVESVSRTVTLASNNEVSVTTNGKPGSVIYVMIMAAEPP